MLPRESSSAISASSAALSFSSSALVREGTPEVPRAEAPPADAPTMVGCMNTLRAANSVRTSSSVMAFNDA